MIDCVSRCRILCPYSEFQLYQVPMLVALAYDGSKLTLRVLRASDDDLRRYTISIKR